MYSKSIFSIENLSVEFNSRNGKVAALKNVSVSVVKGEMLGLVGESGSGKSVAMLTAMGLLDNNGIVTSGKVVLDEVVLDITKRKGSGNMAMVFQYPRLALNPIRIVGHQIIDVLKTIGAKRSAKEYCAEALVLLREVRIQDAERTFNSYPFEISGGMCQRVLIAMALARKPTLLVADEPTTGLDVVTQEAIMDLIVHAAFSRGMATVFITHDLGLAAKYCHRICVMKDGMVIESAEASEIFKNPKHSYTKKLIASTPSLMDSIEDMKQIIEVKI
jgi:peptide/nickel transport system ATP-binding protein